MNEEERQHLAVLINYFWGPNLTTPQAVNEAAAKIAFKALEQANICSSSMDIVPRPSLFPGASYAVKELAKIGKRISSGNSAIYNSCKVQVGVRYKSQVAMALMGI